MSDHGFDVCGIYAIYSTRLVGVVIDDTLPAVSWLHALDHCGTRWLERYSPPPPWRVYWDTFDEIDDVCTWCNQHLPEFIEFWETTCRDWTFDYCAASGETTNE